jgi:hypothetical protein
LNGLINFCSKLLICKFHLFVALSLFFCSFSGKQWFSLLVIVFKGDITRRIF